MPCLNEAETLAKCINKAQSFLNLHHINGEVLIADNGSTDGSQAIALAHRARVVDVPLKGYGAALIAGMHAAHGQYIIMGDSDNSYDFSNLTGFLEKLREGYHLVMGNRFKGSIEPGAMPFLHRYLGNPILSYIGRLFFKSRCGDFHCGLRGFNRDAFLGLNLCTTGMEFASEMVVKASLASLTIAEVPITLLKDGRSRPPHLKTWGDGWRHLRFLLMYCPRWLYLYPGLALFLAGACAMLVLVRGRLQLGSIVFDVHTLLVAGVFTIIGSQILIFGAIAKQYCISHGLHPDNDNAGRLFKLLKLDNLLLLGIISTILGVGGIIRSALFWRDHHFGNLDYETILRLLIPSCVAVVIGIEIVFAAFLMGMMSIPIKPASAK